MLKQKDISLMLCWYEHFRYVSGKLYWKHDVITGRGRLLCQQDSEAGGPRKRGRFTYWAVGLYYKRYYRHRIVWEMINGPIPCGYVINHLNGIPGDDRIDNLELILGVENNQTKKSVNMYSTNTSGRRGVNFEMKRGKWVAKGWENNKTKHLGRYLTFEEACEARDRWELSLGAMSVSSF